MPNSDIHILILSSWYPTEDNPFLGNFVKRQAQLLGSKYKVTVLHTSSKEIDSIAVNTKEEDTFKEVSVFYNGNGNVLSRKRNQRKALKEGFKQISDVDLIIGNVLLPLGWQFVAAKKKYKAPLFYIEHGSYFREDSPFMWNSFYNIIKSQVEKKADVIIAVSAFLKKDLNNHFKGKEIEVIGNHIKLDLFKPKEKSSTKKTKFLHVSTLDRNTKNPFGIIEAIDQLRKETTNFEFTFVCDENTDEWQELVHIKDLSEFVQFVGPIEWEKLDSYYHSADAFVLFSDYETFSIVLVEALATGTPLITTPVGIAESLSDELGLLVEKQNSEDLKNKMLKFVKGKKFNSEKLVAAAQEYSSEAILDKWSSLIEKHLG